MIHVIATIDLHPGTREKFLREFAVLTPQVRAEAGCIEYGGAVDIPTGISVQIPLRPDTVVIVEKWATLDALRAHLAAPHMDVYRNNVKDFVRGASAEILSPVPD
jgi:quinol monooxygenase YgiN